MGGGEDGLPLAFVSEIICLSVLRRPYLLT
jgi:hypothetical protein